MDRADLERAHARGDGPAPELVGAQERGFATAVAVLAQGARVLACSAPRGSASRQPLRHRHGGARPTLLVISKSSIKPAHARQAQAEPGAGSTALKARDTSGIPGPSSAATMTMPAGRWWRRG